MTIQKFIDNITNMFDKYFNAKLESKSAEIIAGVASNQIKTAATKEQLLDGERHQYKSAEYARRKGLGKAGHGQDLKKVKKSYKKGETKGSNKNKNSHRVYKSFKRGKAKLGHNTQNEFVDMWLTGELWDSLQMHSMLVHELGTDILIGFDDTEVNNNKIKQANNYGRTVLALSDSQADKVAEAFMVAKAQEIIKFPDKITVEIA